MGYKKDGELSNVNSLYSELLIEIYSSRWTGPKTFDESMISLRKLVPRVKKRTVSVLEKHCETALFMMKIHI